MKIEQLLSSGMLVRQDIRQAVRFVMFETGVEGWDYATHGGTLLIINCGGRPYGVTCHHVRQDFEWSTLAITDARFGRQIAGLKGVLFASQPTGVAIDSDLLDLVIIEFADDVGPSFFGDNAYIFDSGTVSSSASGNKLAISGALKDQSEITENTIAPVFAYLEFEDRGIFGADPVLRQAIAQFSNPEFSRVTGLSGAPVFNLTRGKLSGIVVRGSMDGAFAKITYVDISHLAEMLKVIVRGKSSTAYRIVVPR